MLGKLDNKAQLRKVIMVSLKRQDLTNVHHLPSRRNRRMLKITMTIGRKKSKHCPDAKKKRSKPCIPGNGGSTQGKNKSHQH